MMARPDKHCSNCGERIGVPAGIRKRSMRLCKTCASRMRYRRAGMSIVFAGLLAVSFIFGRATAPKQPFQFIGTPITDVGSVSSGQESGVDTSIAAVPSKTAEAVESICGAPTRSGKPCQRRVKFGGRCWQHRAVDQKKSV